jgi:hypothetical protein
MRSAPLARFRARHLLSSQGARRRRIQGLRPAGVPAGRAEAWSVGPVTYQGRALQTIQLFFADRGRHHHVTLLWPAANPETPLRKALEALLASYTTELQTHRCHATPLAPARRTRPSP